MSGRRLPLLAIGITALALTALLIGFGPRISVQSGAPAAPELQETPNPNLSIPNSVCLSCHGQPGLTMPLENGQLFGLYVPPELYHDSIHGELGYACVQCHDDVGNYPHPPFSAADVRDVTLQLYTVCERCHASYYELVDDSVHADAFRAGNREAAVCTDCHTAHAVRRLTDPDTNELLNDARVWVPQTCARCHYTIYQKYSKSVHGSALLGEGNPDVPTCIDCHGVHNIEDPTTSEFRLQSPELCAGCHTDPELMAKYGLSTDVLSTYVADFHGTTVTIFEREHPDQETNKPVCFDCHGVHDIPATDDPVAGLQLRENLLARCQECHPDATANFPDAWLSHYIPSPEHNPLVFTINTFYSIFIPTVLGGMAILVAMDVGSTFRNRFRRRRPRAQVFDAPEPEVDARMEESELRPQDDRIDEEEPPSGAEDGSHDDEKGRTS